MAGNIILPSHINVAVLIHGDLRIYRAISSVGGEHLRRRERDASVARDARAAEPNGEVTSVALPNNADVAGGIHCDLRDGVESRDNFLGEIYWRGESITPIGRTAEKDIRGTIEVRSILPDHIDAAAGIHCNARVEREASTVGDALWRRKRRSPIGRTAKQDIRVRVGIIFPHHVDVPTQI